ncbi:MULTISPECIES: TetR/AcrR family transcriptional regulator [Halobacillus]|uniref:TetR/AcrR family transcriptional regulator n=1 Tax=Halobacillus TaxID=45667 RepID=UPI0013715538|nr:MULTISPECIES: TetR/AcrR family transcriptional regulator [Halobacillus]MYL30247.1 TetR family transcriptional regulator [Halobacillus halophilus]MYL38238.1 TetR family transcriptional regulator [Halobacillus litoralis]
MNDLKDMMRALEQEDGEEKNLTPKQAQILKAAVEIFAEKGYASSSTSEIAARANVAEGTIFRHYKTKKDLLISIVTPFMAKFMVPFFAARFTRRVFDEPPEEFRSLLSTILKDRFAFAAENAPLLRIVLQEMAFHPELQQRFQDVFIKDVYPKFEAALDRLKQGGQVVDKPNSTIIRMIMSAVMGFLITRFILSPDLDWDDEREIEETVAFIMYGLAEK